MELQPNKNEDSSSKRSDNASLNKKRIEDSVQQVVQMPRDYNNQTEVDKLVVSAADTKSHNSIDKTLFLGFLAGIFVSLSAILSLVAAGGISIEIRQTNPAIPKLIFGALFPVGLFLIVLFGGDLFTGNTMIMTVAYLGQRVTARDLLKNWVLVFISNFIGCIFGAYFFGHLTDIFTDANIVLYLKSIVEKKAHLSASAMFFRAIPANTLVCLAIFLGLTARDVIGKIVGLWIPIFAFAVCGYEHCVANMFLFTMGLMVGAEITYSQVALNLTLVVLGNTVGGGFLVGFSEYYLYHWSVGTPSPHKDDRRIRTGIQATVIPHDAFKAEKELRLRRRLIWRLCRLCGFHLCCGRCSAEDVEPGADTPVPFAEPTPPTPLLAFVSHK